MSRCSIAGSSIVKRSFSTSPHIKMFKWDSSARCSKYCSCSCSASTKAVKRKTSCSFYLWQVLQTRTRLAQTLWMCRGLCGYCYDFERLLHCGEAHITYHPRACKTNSTHHNLPCRRRNWTCFLIWDWYEKIWRHWVMGDVVQWFFQCSSVILWRLGCWQGSDWSD